MYSHVDRGVEGQAGGAGGERLVHAHAPLRVDDLSVKVTGVHNVMIHQAKCAYEAGFRVQGLVGVLLLLLL
jgi:hypothetical protein